MEREEHLWKQLAATVQFRTSGDHITWQIFGFFVAANGGLLAGLATNRGSLLLRLLLTVVGVFMNVVWAFLESRAIAHLIVCETVHARLERELNIPSRLALNDNSANERILNQGVPAKLIMQFMPIVLALCWSIAARPFSHSLAEEALRFNFYSPGPGFVGGAYSFIWFLVVVLELCPLRYALSVRAAQRRLRRAQ